MSFCAGIAVLTVFSFYPLIYYGLLCQTVARLFYLISVTVLGVAVVSVSLLDFFQKAQWRTFRYCLFSGLGLYAIFPIVHILLLHFSVPRVRSAMAWDIVHGVFYLGGGAIYAARIPERFFPGRFDLVLNSHQVMHSMVLAAAVIHWRCSMELMEWRDSIGAC